MITCKKRYKCILWKLFLKISKGLIIEIFLKIYILVFVIELNIIVLENENLPIK